jgi:hypothetical protein
MDRFIGRSLDVLLEEELSGAGESDNLWLGRLCCHAPEVDGAAVIVGAKQGQAAAGNMVPCRVIARRGFDLEVYLRP